MSLRPRICLARPMFHAKGRRLNGPEGGREGVDTRLNNTISGSPRDTGEETRRDLESIFSNAYLSSETGP